jgi:gamma-glutamyltranspeptidase/glutathione hydrolase
MVQRFGKLPFREVVAPARELAEQGFLVSWFLAQAAAQVVRSLPQGWALAAWLAPGGAALLEGRKVRRSALARTLEELAEQGVKGFYQGWVADDLLAAVTEGGGVMTKDDLLGYKVIERTPLRGRVGDYQIVTMPLPSSGGVALLEALGIIWRVAPKLGEAGAGSSVALHVQSEALKHAFADRARYLGDAESAEKLVPSLLDEARLDGLAKRFSPKRTQPHDRYGDKNVGVSSSRSDGGTSHLCVVDEEGNAVALTTTVNGYFGNKAVAPKSGVVLNNEMDDFTIAEGAANMFGLSQSNANLVAGGKRPLSSMTPTLVLKGDEVVGCVGGSGGPRIISNTMQALINVMWFGMDARAAVDAPRVHHQWQPDELVVEKEIAKDVIEALERRGHRVIVSPAPTAVQLLWKRNGVWEAASDPRKGGAPAVQAARK